MTAFTIPSSQPGNDPLRILLIEDDEGDRDLALEYLKEDSQNLYQVTWANSLEDGLDKLDTQQFDAIILDLVLPDSRGVATVSKLCAQSGHTPVIVSSYFDENALANKVIELGAQDYLAKDLMDGQTLGRTMSRVIARARRQAVQLSERRSPAEKSSQSNPLEAKVRKLQADLQRLEAIASSINSETKDDKASLEESRQRMIKTLSHECRSPATAVLLATSILKSYDAQVADSRYLSAVSRIDEAVRRMMKLLDSALSFDRTQSIIGHTKPERFDLQVLCQQAIARIKSNLQPAPKITTHYIGDCSNVCLYQEVVKIILEQLLLNAVMYSPERSPITVTVESTESAADKKTAEQQVILTVKDQGRGMTESEKAQAFEAFYRSSHVDNIHGLGLGLTIVSTCLDLCGGQIKLESEEGKGTTVAVTLPLAE